jgi:hypothetical protein
VTFIASPGGRKPDSTGGRELSFVQNTQNAERFFCVVTAYLQLIFILIREKCAIIIVATMGVANVVIKEPP